MELASAEEVEVGKLIRIHGTKTAETEKAILFEMDGEIPYDEWFPKSQLHEDAEGAWFCREWIAKAKGLV